MHTLHCNINFGLAYTRTVYTTLSCVPLALFCSTISLKICCFLISRTDSISASNCLLRLLYNTIISYTSCYGLWLARNSDDFSELLVL